jgi:hypothetical protein
MRRKLNLAKGLWVGKVKVNSMITSRENKNQKGKPPKIVGEDAMPNESRILEIGSYGLARRGRLKDLFFTLLSAFICG